MLRLFTKFNNQTGLSQKLSFGFSIENFVIKKGYLLPKPPDRPLSVYIKYSQLKSKDYTGVTLAQYAGKIAECYKNTNLDKDLKQQLENQYTKEKAEYEKLKKQYDDSYGIPKQKVSAYALFIGKYQGKEEKAVDRMKSAAKQWQKVSEQEAQKYEKESQKLLNQSEKQKESLEKFRIPLITRVSGYSIFVREFKGTGKEGEKILIQAARGWGKLDDKQKEVYNQRAVKEQKQQVETLEKFCQQHHITVQELEKLQKKSEKKKEETPKAERTRSSSVATTRKRSVSTKKSAPVTAKSAKPKATKSAPTKSTRSKSAPKKSTE